MLVEETPCIYSSLLRGSEVWIHSLRRLIWILSGESRLWKDTNGTGWRLVELEVAQCSVAFFRLVSIDFHDELILGGMIHWNVDIKGSILHLRLVGWELGFILERITKRGTIKRVLIIEIGCMAYVIKRRSNSNLGQLILRVLIWRFVMRIVLVSPRGFSPWSISLLILTEVLLSIVYCCILIHTLELGYFLEILKGLLISIISIYKLWGGLRIQWRRIYLFWRFEEMRMY